MGIGIGGFLGIFGGYSGGNLGLFAGVVLVGTLGGFIGNGIYGLFTGHIQQIRDTEQRVEQRVEQRMLRARAGLAIQYY